MAETVVTARSYAASPEKVFAAWTDVEVLSSWFGCATNMLWTVHEWDVRVGGAIHVSLDFDDHVYEVHGRFLEVERPHLLRYSWEHDQIITVRIVPDGSGSRLTVEHAGLPDPEMGGIVTTGWSASVEQLEGVLQ